jgi:serine/threonine protein kinase
VTLARHHASLEIGPYLALARLEDNPRSSTYVAARENSAGALALARLRTQLSSGGHTTRSARFVAQARRLRAIDHRNLVRVEAIDDEWVALEWLQGRDLRTLLSRFARAQLRSAGVAHLVTERVLDQMRHRLPTSVALFIMRELASGLCALHDAGLVAGALSASAVTISWDGAVKLDQTAIELHRPTTLGAPPPSRSVPTDARGDVWNAGVILWEMLAGRAIDRNEPRLGDVLARGDVPESLARVLSVEPGQRVNSAAELRQLIDDELGQLHARLDGSAVAELLHELFDGEAKRDAARSAAWLEEARRLRRPPSRPQGPRVTAARLPAIGRSEAAKGPAALVAVGAAPASDATPRSYIGQLIDGRYRVERLIGEGGMGWVFEVQHEQIGRRLAMKVLNPDHNGSREGLERFRREARAASAIGHPSIVDVTDSGHTDQGSVYFVMELLQGRELGTLTARGEALAVLRALGIARQMARALAAAHRAGIVHRDLKPENVFLVERDGNPDFVKVLDFGIATAPGPAPAQPGLTRPGLIMGTPEYMAPEQALGGVADARSDIYSCAAIFYELLAGSTPYAPGNPVDLLARKTVSDAIPLGDVAPHVPRALQELIMRCLSRDPNQRAQTMEEVIVALDRIERTERAERTAPLGVQALLTPPANDVIHRAAQPRAQQWSWPRLALLVGAVIALATTSLLWLGNR